MKNRVVVTGIGVITPIGIGKDAYWEGLKEGRSGVDGITAFDTAEYPVQIAAQVKDFNPENYMDRKEARRMDRFIQFAVASAGLALEDSGLDLGKVDLNRVGVSVGSGIGGVQTMEEQARVLIEKGPRRISPFLVPMMITNMASGCVSIAFGAKGPNTTLVTACATSTHSVGDAYKILQRGDADVMFAGGSEAAITPLSVAGFCASRALSTRNHEPSKASRPFDAQRDGFVMGEGAAVLIMETLEHARARDARIYAEVCGFGMSGDGYHITAPDPQGDGAARCIANALADAGMEPGDIDYINAHGTSTPLNDKLETMAIKKVFKELSKKIPVSSTKSMIGHLLGAAGGAELAASMLSMYHSMIHPTVNYENPDPECDLDYVPGKCRETEIKACLSNSFGFGGTNASLIIRKVLE
ncbi:beta-ketoacyl-ACP synthase II [Candidatus Contubernalis alkaliaceticus]|uniref:beta-ketoacyl-ACP synthase II n=1 Tax=Candidatus Contubernalis alkaliaceticus TaxID=338645 RepID=UPI001F4C268A|nr:beta-ketoacyl-ACP synthase II [Candidatus Contubernalis alkalaceticus]UNC92753.1 beta-ketoacyl-ACP synthase II [Candidatus Contubernalis alkalaceticus]